MIPSLLRSIDRLALTSRCSQSVIRNVTQTVHLQARKLCLQPPPADSNPNKPSKYVTLTEDVIKKLTEGNEELVKKLKIVEFEYEVSKQEGVRTPTKLTLENWKELLSMESRSHRKKYLSYLFKVEMIRLNEKQKKEERKLQREARKLEIKKEASDNHIEYGLGRNTIMLKLYDSKIDHYHNSKMIRASTFENPIVFDLGYDEHMNKKELLSAASQLMFAFSQNREHDQPFPIQFCNVNFNGGVMKNLVKFIPSLYQMEFPISISTKSYLDMFPREKLVYLTPHCRGDMESFDHDSVYIIGCMVDKRDNEPLSLAKAKRENIRMARLPLDRYLSFAGGSGKSMTLNSMMSIMLEMKQHGNWDLALRHVPRRKLKNISEIETQSKGKRYENRERLDEFSDLLFADVATIKRPKRVDSPTGKVKLQSN